MQTTDLQRRKGKRNDRLPKPGVARFSGTLRGQAARAVWLTADGLGLTSLGATLRQGELVADGQLLDGLVSIWQLPSRD